MWTKKSIDYVRKNKVMRSLEKNHPSSETVTGWHWGDMKSMIGSLMEQAYAAGIKEGKKERTKEIKNLLKK